MLNLFCHFHASTNNYVYKSHRGQNGKCFSRIFKRSAAKKKAKIEAKIGSKLVHVVAQFSHFTELSVACLVFLGIAFSFLILIRYQRH